MADDRARKREATARPGGRSSRSKSSPHRSSKPGAKGGSSRGSKPGAKGGSSRAGPERSSGGANGQSKGARSRDRPSRTPKPERPASGRAKQWGSLAQSGARRASEPEPARPARPTDALTAEEQQRRLARAERRAVREAEQDRLRAEARDAVDRAEGRRRPKRGSTRITARPDLPKVPLALDEPEVAMARLVGPEQVPRLVRSLGDASQAFARERYNDARRMLAPAVRAVPDVPEVAELQGLIQYRLGNWKAATDQLERFRVLTGTTEQHPVLADCYRALGRYADVDELWDELREASPSAELVTEGRIVAAGARADQGDVAGAIGLLEKGWRRPKRPRPHHLRRAYALADLYERDGRVTRARELFRWIRGHDPGFADVARRMASL